MTATHIGTCTNPACRRKRLYLDRKAARHDAKAQRAGGHMNTFPCPVNEAMWHVGHLPASVRNGTVPKGRYLSGKVPVFVTVEAGVVSVTFTDAKDAARLCDALLEAAEAAARRGDVAMMRRYTRLGHSVADACDRSALPDCNASAADARDR